MVERIVFKGMTAEQAEKISSEEFMKLIGSRARRSAKRNFFRYKELVEKAAAYKKKGTDKPIKTHIREAVIPPQWVGLTFGVHNGKEFQTVVVTSGMIGRRLGDFAYSTKRVQHSAPGIKATRGSKFIGDK